MIFLRDVSCEEEVYSIDNIGILYKMYLIVTKEVNYFFSVEYSLDRPILRWQFFGFCNRFEHVMSITTLIYHQHIN